jgi:mono/diheme cytochrome c family protein
MPRSIAGKIFMWLGIGVGTIIVIVLIAVATFYYRTSRIINKHYDAGALAALYVPKDSATVIWGQHFAVSIAGCTECHGTRLEGSKFFDDPAFARLYPPNLTRGHGGLPSDFDIVAFDRVLRYGIRPDGTSLWLMPSYHYWYMSDTDVAALWAYLASLPPVDQVWPERKLGPVGTMLMAQGKLPILSAPWVPTNATRPAKPAADSSASYGEYLVHVSCIGCHGTNLSGGPIDGAPPDWPPASNITKGGALANYTESDFFTALHDGKRPGGNPISPIMPWKSFSGMTDTEIRAVWNRLQSLPPAQYATGSWAKAK